MSDQNFKVMFLYIFGMLIIGCINNLNASESVDDRKLWLDVKLSSGKTIFQFINFI